MNTRTSAARQRVLDELRTGGKLNTELNGICFRYGARIHELRKGNYDIKTEPVSNGVYRYVLVSEPSTSPVVAVTPVTT